MSDDITDEMIERGLAAWFGRAEPSREEMRELREGFAPEMRRALEAALAAPKERALSTEDWEDELRKMSADVPLDKEQYDEGAAMYRRITPLLNAAELPLTPATTIGLLMAACATAHMAAPTLPTEVFVEVARFVFVQGKRMRRQVPVA